MKQTTLNYLAIIFAWCFFLSKLELISFILLFIMCLYLFFKNEDINLIRLISSFVILITLFTTIIKISNLDSFYSLINYFVIILSFNLAIFNETQRLLKLENILSLYVLSIIITLIFVIIALALPDSLYTIFTKAHLYSLIGLIFIPNISNLTILFISKA